jgi:hypothetical protein
MVGDPSVALWQENQRLRTRIAELEAQNNELLYERQHCPPMVRRYKFVPCSVPGCDLEAMVDALDPPDEPRCCQHTEWHHRRWGAG